MPLPSWLTGVFTFFTPAKKVVDDAPAKTVSVVKAMLDKIEYESGHPVLLAATNFLEDMIVQHGEPFLEDLEAAILTALMVKNPALAPALMPFLPVHKTAVEGTEVEAPKADETPKPAV